ncbi:hypothetical protein E2C01_018077 [Portunus trituberculatus]|uniref:Uncharacterized protein n=1 Tax=Portunus trituberculatus TaxID=210409 RepID=A0A5B7DTK5_PORTR|nr:hypothetical protein [Portunus trituberculatus]
MLTFIVLCPKGDSWTSEEVFMLIKVCFTSYRVPSWEGTRNVPRSDCFLDNNPKSLDISLNFSYINFCNIRSLRSNFESVEHHLSSTKPHLLFLTETQLPEETDSSPFSVPSYFLYSHFLSKADPLKRRCSWRFASASWGDLTRYYADFPWSDYSFRVRDPFLCAERITEVDSICNAYGQMSEGW